MKTLILFSLSMIAFNPAAQASDLLIKDIATVQFAFSHEINIPANVDQMRIVDSKNWLTGNITVCDLLLKDKAPVQRKIKKGINEHSIDDYTGFFPSIIFYNAVDARYSASVKHLKGGVFNQWMILTPSGNTSIKEIRCGFKHYGNDMDASFSRLPHITEYDVGMGFYYDDDETIQFFEPTQIVRPTPTPVPVEVIR